MSTQSILQISRERYFSEIENSLLCMSDNYYNFKKFSIGHKLDRDKLNHAMLFHELLCTDVCEMINFIQKKIEGKLEEKTCKKSPKQTLQELIQKYKHEFSCDDQQVLNDCCSWESAEW